MRCFPGHQPWGPRKLMSQGRYQVHSENCRAVIRIGFLWSPWTQNSLAASWMEGVSFSSAGGARLEVRGSSSRPDLPVALSDRIRHRLGPDFHPCFEDVATQLPLGAGLQSDLTHSPKDRITPQRWHPACTRTCSSGGPEGGQCLVSSSARLNLGCHDSELGVN